MQNTQSLDLRRHLVGKDGTIYWIRSVRKVCRSAGMYMPMKLINLMGWGIGHRLMIWTSGSIVLLADPKDMLDVDQVTVTVPKFYRLGSYSEKISKFQEVEK